MQFVFLLLKQDSLSILSSGNQNPPLAFPPEIIKHQEILDKGQYETLLKEYLSHFPKSEAIIVLYDDIIFPKSIAVTDQTVLDDEIRKFLDTVPFSSSAVEKTVLQSKTSATFYATNSELYKTILTLTQTQGWQIKHVVPLTLFKQLIQNQELSFASLSRIRRERGLLEQGNFLSSGQKDSTQEQSTKNEKNPAKIKQIIMLSLSFLFLAGTVVFALFNQGVIALPKTENSSTAPTPVISPTTSVVSSVPTASISNAPQELSIQILNGSGVAGQATKVRDQLESIGFTDIATGNAPTTVTQTSIAFSDTVLQQSKDAIMKELQKTFADVAESASGAASYDVVITTGEELVE